MSLSIAAVLVVTAVPLVLLIVDLFVLRGRGDKVVPQAAAAAPLVVDGHRPVRLAPGDGMVYRGTAPLR